MSKVKKGFDFFKTIERNKKFGTQFQFKKPFTIPKDFFDSGSEEIQNRVVRFRGEPIGRFHGQDIGTADTIINRLDDANLAQDGSSALVKIKIEQLSLTSVEPLRVKVGKRKKSTQKWDVDVSQSPTQSSDGTMTIKREDTKWGDATYHQSGGTFESKLRVIPLLRFIRKDPPKEILLDLGALGLSKSDLDKLILMPKDGKNRPKDVPWADPRQINPKDTRNSTLVLPGLNDDFGASNELLDEILTDFVPAKTPDEKPKGRKKDPTGELAELAKHGVFPAQPRHGRCPRMAHPTKLVVAIGFDIQTKRVVLKRSGNAPEPGEPAQGVGPLASPWANKGDRPLPWAMTQLGVDVLKGREVLPKICLDLPGQIPQPAHGRWRNPRGNVIRISVSPGTYTVYVDDLDCSPMPFDIEKWVRLSVVSGTSCTFVHPNVNPLSPLGIETSVPFKEPEGWSLQQSPIIFSDELKVKNQNPSTILVEVEKYSVDRATGLYTILGRGDIKVKINP